MVLLLNLYSNDITNARVLSNLHTTTKGGIILFYFFFSYCFFFQQIKKKKKEKEKINLIRLQWDGFGGGLNEQIPFF